MSVLAYETWNVFTQRRFAGNPLAVVWGGDGLSGEDMQLIAREFNYSETVFICAANGAGGAAALRIFTPTMELPFAGHPTIGAALALLGAGKVRGSGCELDVPAGRVDMTFAGEGDGVQARLTPPQIPQIVSQEVRSLEDVIGLAREAAILTATAGTAFAFVELGDQTSVDAAVIGPGLGAYIASLACVGLYVFCKAGPENVYARLLADEIGLSEDPATGSAAAALAAVLAQQNAPLGDYIIQQGVQMGRPGEIYLTLKAGGNCTIGGYGVKVMAGTLEM